MKRLALVLSTLAVGLTLGTVCRPLPADALTYMRVGVVDNANSVLVSSSTAGDFLDERGHVVVHLAAMEGWNASSNGNGIQVQGPNGQSAVVVGSLWLMPSSAAGIPLVFAQRHWYRGTLELRAGTSGVTVVNRLPIEQYLYGVVPSEVPKTWPLAALKSQAVAARSYALANISKHKGRGYDVCDSDDCQVYTGASAESAATNSAIDQTRGEVLISGGKVIPAYFCASAGGYTENSEDVWVQKLGFIRAVPDYDQSSPHYTWYKNVAASTIQSNLARQGVLVGQLYDVKPLERSFSGRIKTVQVSGAAGTRVISGEAFRMAAGLGSTLFNVAARGQGTMVPSPGASPQPGYPDEFAFAGRGFGHGLGMSQWGAKTLGEKGYTYQVILKHYYPGAELKRRLD